MHISDVTIEPEVGQWWICPKPLRLMRLTRVDPNYGLGLIEYSKKGEREWAYVEMPENHRPLLFSQEYPLDTLPTALTGDAYLSPMGNILFTVVKESKLVILSDIPFKVDPLELRLYQCGSRSPNPTTYTWLDSHS